MKRLAIVNLIGVLCLVGLCIAQWRRDRELNLELYRLQREAHEQASRLEEQAKEGQGLNADLAEFKKRYDGTSSELAQLRGKLGNAEREARRLAVERDQLGTRITNWMEAVSVRDQRLKESAGQVRRLGEELDASVLRFNSLASNHNRLVKDLNELRSRLTQPPSTASPTAPHSP